MDTGICPAAFSNEDAIVNFLGKLVSFPKKTAKKSWFAADFVLEPGLHQMDRVLILEKGEFFWTVLRAAAASAKPRRWRLAQSHQVFPQNADIPKVLWCRN
jgi:hypothetical protein